LSSGIDAIGSIFQTYRSSPVVRLLIPVLE
jgi:hypothetical protein